MAWEKRGFEKNVYHKLTYTAWFRGIQGDDALLGIGKGIVCNTQTNKESRL